MLLVRKGLSCSTDVLYRGSKGKNSSCNAWLSLIGICLIFIIAVSTGHCFLGTGDISLNAAWAGEVNKNVKIFLRLLKICPIKRLLCHSIFTIFPLWSRIGIPVDLNCWFVWYLILFFSELHYFSEPNLISLWKLFEWSIKRNKF